MPVGPYPTFRACVADQQRKGHDANSARRICGEIEKRSKAGGASGPERQLDAKADDGAFLRLGRSLDLPLPGLSRTLDKPGHTRLVKDVLRPGDWHVMRGGRREVWHVDEATLHSLAANFAEFKARGNQINWIWNHSHDNRDAIAPVDEMVVHDGRLWATGYFPDEQARDLMNPARKVSIEAVENFIDGEGNVYSEFPVHIAVVELPVVSGQGNFAKAASHYKQTQRAMALSLLKSQPTQPKDAAMDFETMKAQLNELFKAFGIPEIPDHVSDETTLEMWVKDAVSFVGGDTGDGDGDAAAEGGDTGVPPSDTTIAEGEVATALSTLTQALKGNAVNASKPGADNGSQAQPKDLSAQIEAAVGKAVNAAVEPLQKKLSALESEKQASAQQQYEDRIKELGQAGLPGEECQRLSTLGRNHGWDMALLANAEHHPQVDMGRVAKGHRSAAAPQVAGGNGQMSDEEVQAELKKRGRDPEKMPVARH